MSGTNEAMRAPRQARSQASAGRMLDAALAILEREGAAGLTIAAVSQESGVSNGSLYHRFGDRQGLLLAAQQRFLEKLEADWLSASAPLWQSEDLDTVLARLVEEYLETFAAHRRIFHAFMVTGYNDPELRARGAETGRRIAHFMIEQLTGRFGCSPEAADTAHRILFSQVTLMTMFADEEISARAVNAEVRRAQLAAALKAVLAG
ncbi:TetR/AcrR family transcriptional regulator [Streptomyces sp. DB-54]